MKVHVVTDSTCYLPKTLLSDVGVGVVSLYYGFGEDGLRREGALDSFNPFYRELVDADDVAHTSPPSVEDFVAVYEPLLAAGGDIVSIHISSGLSETCTNARRAAAELAEPDADGERIDVIDSAAAAGPLGLIVLAAARAAATGDLEAVGNRARRARQESGHRFFVDTLEFLRRGGRIGTAAAWMGSALSVKPILVMESEIKAIERVRTRARAVDRLVEFCRRQATAGADAWFIQHADAEEEARALADRLQEIFWRPPEFLSEIGPAIGTHTGPGSMIAGSMPSQLLD